MSTSEFDGRLWTSFDITILASSSLAPWLAAIGRIWIQQQPCVVNAWQIHEGKPLPSQTEEYGNQADLQEEQLSITA